jgi:4-hydroxy-tetrahydrodipicolinate synthase
MLTDKLRGAGVALVTPFRDNGTVDYQSLAKVTEHTIREGVDFLVALGTTAETPTLDRDEKAEIVDTILKTDQGRVPVILGMGGNDTRTVIKQIHDQSFNGIDGILSVAPYYNKPGQSGLFRHFEAIAGESPVPVIIYNVPGRTGSNISAETTVKLAHECRNIIATKEASGNLDQIMAILRDRPAEFLVLSGDDALTLPLVALGAEGVISVIANYCPGKMSRMVKMAASGNLQEARRIHFEILELIQLIFSEGSPAGIKGVLSHIGLTTPAVRLPLVAVSEHLSQRLAGQLGKME